MSSNPQLGRRVFLFTSGVAAAGIPQAVAAQQTNETDGNTTATDTATEPTVSQPTDAFDPDIDVDCYSVRIDAETYDSVTLSFVDETVRFGEGYSGQREFGFSGDGVIEAGSETAVEEFYGPIEQVTVTAGGASQTVDREEGPCVFENLRFECDSAIHEQADDVRIEFADGSSKMWDPPADLDQSRFGSPGRVIETITEAGADITVDHPGQDCAPGEYATVFDCTEVTITAAEFGADPTFDWLSLRFTDGSSQAFGSRSDGPNFTAPETVAGTDDHEGKLIESVVITKRDGDVSFKLLNPTVDACQSAETAASNGTDAEPAETNATAAESGADSVATGDGESTAADGDAASNTTDGDVASVSRFEGPDETDDARGAPPAQSDGGETNEDALATLVSAGETGADVASLMPWWGWVTAVGGAGGVGSYLVSRMLGEAPADETATGGGPVDSAAVDDSGSGDDTETDTPAFSDPDRWEEFDDR